MRISFVNSSDTDLQHNNNYKNTLIFQLEENPDFSLRNWAVIRWDALFGAKLLAIDRSGSDPQNGPEAMLLARMRGNGASSQIVGGWISSSPMSPSSVSAAKIGRAAKVAMSGCDHCISRFRCRAVAVVSGSTNRRSKPS